MCRIFLSCCCIALLLLAAPGCKKGGKSITLDSIVKNQFGGKTTPTELVAAVFDESDPDVRRAALEELSEEEWALRDPHLKRFAELAQPCFEEDASVRAIAVRSLGKAGDKKYVPEVIIALDDPDATVRWDAAVVLDKMPDDRAIAKLQARTINDSSVDVRASAARALKHYRSDPVFRTLLRALDDQTFSVRTAAHEALVFQTGHDRGYDPEKWAGGKDQTGQETLPTEVRYKKRPWWDWFKLTKESETVPQ